MEERGRPRRGRKRCGVVQQPKTPAPDQRKELMPGSGPDLGPSLALGAGHAMELKCFDHQEGGL